MLRLLTRSDSWLLQSVFDACSDYALMQDGQPFAPDVAQLEFDEVPAGFPTEAKRIFAIEPAHGSPVGIIEGLCGYPKPNIWFIGLMLIVPQYRRSGLGRLALDELEAHILSVDSCSEIELAVLKVNTAGLRFWERRGFALRREAPAAAFGQKTHERWVLGKRIGDAGLTYPAAPASPR
jgi:GNAT superfamily N-acetyltransferase